MVHVDHPAKFGDHMSNGSQDMVFLVIHILYFRLLVTSTPVFPTDQT